jgi:predicted ATPase
MLDTIHDKTRGNAQLLAQVVQTRDPAEWGRRTDVKTGSLVEVDTLREAIAHYLRSLTDDVGVIVTAAAVFGQNVDVAPLSGVLGRTNAEVLEALDAASQARVMTKIGPGTFRFTYPLVRDVLHQRVPAVERARLHGLAAAVLEERLAGSRDYERIGEIAAHLVEACATGEAGRAVDWSLRAADLAHAAGDRKATAKYAERGLEAIAFDPKPDAEKLARLRARAAKGRA